MNCGRPVPSTMGGAFTGRSAGISKILLVSMMLGLMNGCSFDEKWQKDIQFPALLVIKNGASSTIENIGVGSSLEAESGFIIQHDRLNPGDIKEFKVSGGVYNDICAGKFLLTGSSGGFRREKLNGRALKREGMVIVERLKVTILISTFNSSDQL